MSGKIISKQASGQNSEDIASKALKISFVQGVKGSLDFIETMSQ